MSHIILTRRVREEIVIGKAGDVLSGPIIVSPAEIRGSLVRVSVWAQEDIDVDRREVREAIDREEAEGAAEIQELIDMETDL